jgi:hypothetical protein
VKRQNPYFDARPCANFSCQRQLQKLSVPSILRDCPSINSGHSILQPPLVGKIGECRLIRLVTDATDKYLLLHIKLMWVQNSAYRHNKMKNCILTDAIFHLIKNWFYDLNSAGGIRPVAGTVNGRVNYNVRGGCCGTNKHIIH